MFSLKKSSVDDVDDGNDVFNHDDGVGGWNESTIKFLERKTCWSKFGVRYGASDQTCRGEVVLFSVDRVGSWHRGHLQIFSWPKTSRVNSNPIQCLLTTTNSDSDRSDLSCLVEVDHEGDGDEALFLDNRVGG